MNFYAGYKQRVDKDSYISVPFSDKKYLNYHASKWQRVNGSFLYVYKEKLKSVYCDEFEAIKEIKACTPCEFVLYLGMQAGCGSGASHGCAMSSKCARQ